MHTLTLSFTVLFAFCRYSFLFSSKLLISVSSVLFLIVDFFVLFCIESIAFVRISLIFYIAGFSSFKALNLFFFFFFLNFYAEGSD